MNTRTIEHDRDPQGGPKMPPSLARRFDDLEEGIGRRLNGIDGEVTGRFEKIEGRFTKLDAAVADVGKTVRSQRAAERVASGLTPRDRVVRHILIKMELAAHRDWPDDPGYAYRRMRDGDPSAPWYMKPPTDPKQIEKAQTDPARLTVPEWAGAISTPDFIAFLAVGFGASLVARLAGLAAYYTELSGTWSNGKIVYPASAPAGGWVGEGEPIPDQKDPLASTGLNVRKAGSIATMTREVLKGGADVGQLIENAVRQGVQNTIDASFVDAVGGDARRPAGLRSYRAGLTGSADMLADLKSLIGAMPTATQPAFIVGPSQYLRISQPQNQPAYPVLDSAAVPAGIVIVVDLASLAIAAGNPSVDSSEEADLVERDDPTARVDAAGVVGKPARSLYQTASTGTRVLLDCGWTVGGGNTAWLSGASW